MTFDPINHEWFPVVDDLVGGWAVATVDRPLSEIDPTNRRHAAVACFVDERHARHIAGLHNASLGLDD